MNKLSSTQSDALREVSLHDGVFVRWNGGFWTWRGCPVDHKLDETSVPGWHVGVATIRALEKAGLIERVNAFDEEWRDDRIITSEGLAAAKEAAASARSRSRVDSIVEDLRDLLGPMTPDERLVVFGDVMEGYCDTCGSLLTEGHQPCHCMRDD